MNDSTTEPLNVRIAKARGTYRNQHHWLCLHDGDEPCAPQLDAELAMELLKEMGGADIVHWPSENPDSYNWTAMRQIRKYEGKICNADSPEEAIGELWLKLK